MPTVQYISDEPPQSLSRFFKAKTKQVLQSLEVRLIEPELLTLYII